MESDFIEDKSESAEGRTIGPYSVLTRLGAGGMGEVYLAQDPRLDRKVALKFLPASFTNDVRRLRRFEQEARAASSLNHPNILTIYEIGRIEGHHFIATEFVDGVTLREHMTGSTRVAGHEGQGKITSINLSEKLNIATQTASALEAAHAAGIVHRDVKPENIMVRRDGYVKVLDFGLAKMTVLEATTASPDAATRVLVNTDPGLVMGTVNYMSPEQARGKTVDPRTDIWSLGIVLYEMFAGRVPFEGETASHVIVSILEKPLPALSLHAEVPSTLESIIEKALRKNRDERYQTVKDLRLDLESLKWELEPRSDYSVPSGANRDQQANGGAPAAVDTDHVSVASTLHSELAARSTLPEFHSRWFNRFGWASLLVLMLLLSIVAVSFMVLRPSKPPAPVSRLIPFTSYTGSENNPSFSPDGNQIAFVWDGEKGDNFDIYVKLIDAGTPLRLTTNPAADSYPAWSPDGRYIAFVRASETGVGIYLIAALGGHERKLADQHIPKHFLGTRLSWSPDGKLLAISDYSLPEQPTSIFLLSVETGEKRQLTSPPAGCLGDFFPAISPDGHSLAFARVTGWGVEDIYVAPILGGEARRITFDKAFTGGIAWTADSHDIVFASSRLNTGSLNLWRISTTGGTPEKLAIGGQTVLSPAISRAGDRLAYGQISDDTNIWRIDMSNGHGDAQTKVIASTRYDMGPQYSPDSKRIAFSSDRSGNWDIWVSDSDGANAVQLTDMGGALTGFPRWSPDGGSITFYSQAAGNSDIYLTSAEGGKPRRLTVESSEEIVSSWSKDGRWIYFGSNRTGDWQIWKMPAAGGAAAQVTKQGGFNSVESLDGKYIYYTKGNDIVGIWKLPVEGGEESLVVNRYKAGYWDYWALVKQGIYFATDETPLPTIQFFSFDTGELSEVAKLEKEKAPLRGTEAGLSVSSDGRSIIYAKRDQRGSDIMLMENFR